MLEPLMIAVETLLVRCTTDILRFVAAAVPGIRSRAAVGEKAGGEVTVLGEESVMAVVELVEAQGTAVDHTVVQAVQAVQAAGDIAGTADDTAEVVRNRAAALEVAVAGVAVAAASDLAADHHREPRMVGVVQLPVPEWDCSP